MRKLAWFAAGFAAACLWACYDLSPVYLLGPLLPALGGWLSTRPRGSGEAVLLRRPAGRGPRPRYRLYQLSRRALAFCLGGVAAFSWAGVYSALFRAPAEGLVGEEVSISGQVSSYPVPTSIGGWSVTLGLDGGFFAPDVLAYGPEEWGTLKPGDRLTGTARVKSSRRAHGDETTYYTAKGVYLLAYCGDDVEIAAAPRVPARHWPALCAHALKKGIYAAFDDTAAPIAPACPPG